MCCQYTPKGSDLKPTDFEAWVRSTIIRTQFSSGKWNLRRIIWLENTPSNAADNVGDFFTAHTDFSSLNCLKKMSGIYSFCQPHCHSLNEQLSTVRK